MTDRQSPPSCIQFELRSCIRTACHCPACGQRPVLTIPREPGKGGLYVCPLCAALLKISVKFRFGIWKSPRFLMVIIERTTAGEVRDTFGEEICARALVNVRETRERIALQKRVKELTNT